MEDGSTYIRGASTKRVDGRRVLLVLAWATAAVLLAVATYLTVETHQHNSGNAELRRHGVAVRVTVTGCQGISSGIGMGIEYWDCTGSFTLAGRSYSEVIHNSRTQRPTGATLDAVVVPSKPSSLSVRTARDSSYVPAIVVWLVTGLVIVGIAFGTTRPPRLQTVPARAK
ncbi:MAG TPA: DUF3592 domain-containing protein [Acidimicrobiales bacterium]|jgi:uncharacterized membrane protein YjfL (UPF0719 family)|nr:DUF3592 domain-containing protein [Acidimicrobiales bacterium]